MIELENIEKDIVKANLIITKKEIKENKIEVLEVLKILNKYNYTKIIKMKDTFLNDILLLFYKEEDEKEVKEKIKKIKEFTYLVNFNILDTKIFDKYYKNKNVTIQTYNKNDFNY